MSRFFRVTVDEVGLTDELFAFVTDPRETRNARPIVSELNNTAPDMIEVLESMVIDGVDQWQYVADYVHAVVGQMRGESGG